jgi:hypothetical protein
MAKLPALLFHVPCVRQWPGVFTVSSRVPSRPVYSNITQNVFTCFADQGVGKLSMALTLAGSGFTPAL